MRKKKKSIIEFGDFQTPPYLANSICELLAVQDLQPSSVIEPTCGKGNLLIAALEKFPSLTHAIGVDINKQYIDYLKIQLTQQSYSDKVKVWVDDFFSMHWDDVFRKLPEPILIIGNPPWVTNAELSTLESDNLPKKTNFKHLSGLSAKTGKSNFDISEWILIRMLELSADKQVSIAMLCKTSVARKVLVYAWKKRLKLESASLYQIDAQQAFSASVDACLLVCKTSDERNDQICHLYSGLTQDAYKTTFGFRDNRLIANIDYYQRWQHLLGQEYYRWRSGVKHDAAKVMELQLVRNREYTNKLGECFELEQDYVYPMLKSSEIASCKTNTPAPTRWMLVTQHYIGEETNVIKHKAPQTWAYLQQYADILDKRKSSIYKNRPRFSIFGVGEYTFADWKVAISGLYKKISFVVVGPYEEKPIVLDDTCYFIPCKNEEEARFLTRLLNSETARQFLEAFIFWDAKRPITIDVLKKLDFVALAKELDHEAQMRKFLQTSRRGKVLPEQLSIWRTAPTSGSS